ncbi:DUF3592 domain-containing protein [Blastopirellula marina]|uniref:DUF3592 domain-containing protein n=1 Tax=Blastopirellula marina TaxID=124 RepID=A0A2S8FWQ8_9BACT|nr:DUF3592 domain-containing protein [Blastopirellula marina]PQO36599.1 hypothetical protein C5Y98_11425 [Blastopirellula marina]PTL44429.1 DUF3592 domain-containing protein [Blastopirellula marina]
MSRVFGTLFVFVFVGFGVCFLGYGIYQVTLAQGTSQWPVVLGKIQKCKLRSHRNEDSTTYACDVAYTYEVNGTAYHGDRIAYGYNGTNNESFHKRVENRLKKSRYVQVHYNPSNPSESVLAAGLFRSTFLPVVFGTAWLAFCGGIASLTVFDGSIKRMPQRLTEVNQYSAKVLH